MTTKKKQLEISAMTPEVITPTLPVDKKRAKTILMQAVIDTTKESGEMTESQLDEFIQMESDKIDERLTVPFPEITPAYKLTEFYNSHQFVKNGISEPYRNPASLLNALIPFMGETDLIVEGSFPVTIAENDEVKTAFSRGMVIKTYNLDADESITYEVGFLYAYDLATPIFKVFQGAKVRACSNLCIFTADDIQEFKIMENSAGAFEQVRLYMDEVTNKMELARQTIQMLKTTFIDKRQLQDFYGQLLFNFQAVENVAGITCITESCKRLQKQGDVYFFDTRPKKDADGVLQPAKTSLWNVFNCLTDKFAKKAILDQPEKVLSIFKEVAPLMYAS